ncbi:Hypothetical protein A7982_03014 [Minicystis rosea]|nr:Hypothetical protein A7982_03014 [Minicystis rosea]
MRSGGRSSISLLEATSAHRVTSEGRLRPIVISGPLVAPS